MEKKVKILFEVDRTSTVVIGLGSDGETMSRRDITGTDLEDRFSKLLNDLMRTPFESGKKLKS